MSQKSDDSIEQFFRKAVVQQDKTFMERDWAAMEKMLDEHAIEAAAARASATRLGLRVGALAVIIALLFIAGVENNVLQKDDVQVQAVVGELGPLEIEHMEGPIAGLHPFSDDCAQQAKVSGALHKSTRNSTPLLRGNKNTKANVSAFASEVVATKPEVKVQTISDGPSQSELSGNADANPMITNSSTNQSQVADHVKPSALTEKPVTGDSLSAEEVTAVSELKGEQKRTSLNFHRLNVTALISPDFSSTSLTKYSKPSGVFGLLLGYRITKRFTMMTGATKSLKRYEGYGHEYSPPDGYWAARTNGVVPDEVEGNCGIIEVPLMLQFDVLQRRKSRLFVAAGVSSYFMQSEHYQYTFNQPNPGAADSWTAKDPTRYLFKIGHVSAGFDRYIGRGFSVGVEPFLKLPFEGIGWTDINLYSTGAYINLRYNIIRVRED